MDVIEIFGAEYAIDWDRLPRGGSFFLPTTATPQQVQGKLRSAAHRLQYGLVARARCEYGVYGVRVWRTY
jgi:hypothetical protein